MERNAQQLQCLESRQNKGYMQADLLPFISYENMVPDELHLRMRISNKLLNQVGGLTKNAYMD